MVRPACVEPDGLRHSVQLLQQDQWLLPAAATAASTTVTVGQQRSAKRLERNLGRLRLRLRQ